MQETDLNINDKNMWLNTEEACRILGVNRETLRKNCAAGKYECKVTKNGRKNEYKIHLASIPEKARKKLHPSQPPVSSDASFYLYNKAPNYAKAKADKYMMILTYSKGLFGQDLKDFISTWNLENPHLKTSYTRVTQARVAYEAYGISGLLGKWGKNKGKTIIKDEYFEYFKSVYLKEGAPTAYSSWIYTLGYAVEIDGVSRAEFPNAQTFIKRLEREVPKQSIFLARYGESAWNRKYANYIERDYSKVQAGKCWVSDHAQVDVAVLGDDGNVYFPWVTAWVDFKSNKWLGWLLHLESGNSDHIFQSFYYAAKGYGVPDDIYIDNGKDYRAKDFAGGRNNDTTVAMITRLEITPHFALPYNAQSKPIERAFLKNKELLSKHFPGYRGGNVVERPEVLKHEIKNGKIMPFHEFKRTFDDFIVNVLNKLPSKSKKLKGMSPDQLFNEEFTEKRVPSQEALLMFCMRASKTVTITRNGVRDSDLQVNYWEEWMSCEKGRKVYIRRDIQDYGTAFVFDAETDEMMGEATLTDIAHAMIKDGISKDELKALYKMKMQDKKIAKKYAKTSDIDVNDKYRHLKLGAEELAPKYDLKTPAVTKIANTHMDKEIQKHNERKKVGTYDISAFVPKDEKKKIYLFASDKEIDEKEYQLREIGL